MLKAKGDMNIRRIEEKLTTNTEIKLTWIPGKRPVNIPEQTPKNNAIIYEIFNMKFSGGDYY